MELWDIESGDNLFTTIGHDEGVTCIKVSDNCQIYSIYLHLQESIIGQKWPFSTKHHANSVAKFSEHQTPANCLFYLRQAP